MSKRANKNIIDSPAFQFYAADYLADENVTLMTLEEEGAYIRAMSYCWREGSIPSDPVLLSRLLKNASPEIVQTVVQRFRNIETETGTRLAHGRLEKERRKQSEWRKKSAEGGKLSGKVRREKKLQTEPSAKGGSQMVEPNVNRPLEPNANSSSSSSSSTSVCKYSRATLEEIYLAYPKRVGKEAAIVAIEKSLRKSKIEPAAMLALVTAYAEQREHAEGHPQYTPNPTTWFNQGRYADETLQPKPKLIWEKVN